MKKFLFLWLLLVGIRGIAAQNIVQAEYFVDHDPGLGNAAQVAFSPSADVTLNFSADISGLLNGFHTLYFRSKDVNGNWSILHVRTFFTAYDNNTPVSANVEQMEYFIDNDPGFGNGTNVVITSGSVVSKSFSVDMTGLSGGFHTLYVRSRDADGLWNVAPASVFYRLPEAIVDPLAHISKMEYFIDKDPGFGNAADVVVVAGANVTKSFSVDLSAVSGGFHTLYVRTQDTDGLWNVAPASVFYRVPDAIVDPLANLVKMEYFIDKDPGFGNATDVTITSGTTVTKSFAFDLTDVSGGFHTLYVRTQDTDGFWNVAPASVFYRMPDAIVDPLANIVKMEYFIDKDPGFGLGNDIAFTSASDVSKSFGVDLTSVPAGFHTMYVRTQDDDGLWNITQAQAFYRAPVSSPSAPAPIVGIEYFFKKTGFTSPVNVFDQFAPSSDVQLTFNPVFAGLQADSVYSLRVYAKDSTGKRSLEYDSSVTISAAWLVNPNHSPMVAHRIDDQNISEDFGAVTIADLDTIFTDSDITAGDSLRYTVSVSNVIVTPALTTTNVLQINSIANVFGTTSMIVIATDDSGAVARDTFAITINPINDKPVAVDDNASATAGIAKVIAVLNNDTDIDGDALTIASVITLPLHGTAVRNAGDTTITYTAVITYSGSDQFQYAIGDGQGGLDTASVNVTVAPGGTLTLSTSVLQNPALSKYADFYVIADTTLSGLPVVKAFVSGDSIPVAMSATSNIRIYKGEITFTQSGSYNIRTQATAVNGAGSTDNHPFNVALSKPGLSVTLSSVNGKAFLKLGTKAVKEETYFTAFENESSTGTVYEFGPKVTLNESVELTITYDPLNFPEAGKLFIYHKVGDNWIRLRTQVYANEHQVKTRTSTLGQFKLGYDPSYEGTNMVPSVFALKQNYPNPFNPSTMITYDVPEDTKLNLTIYNLLGQKVKTLYSGNQLAGTYHTIWNGTNERGQTVASGIYFYRLETRSFVKTQKMLLIK